MVETEVVVHDELVDQHQVAGVDRELLVELRSHGSQFWEVVPGYAGEVMVLNVISNIERH